MELLLQPQSTEISIDSVVKFLRINQASVRERVVAVLLAQFSLPSIPISLLLFLRENHIEESQVIEILKAFAIQLQSLSEFVSGFTFAAEDKLSLRQLVQCVLLLDEFKEYRILLTESEKNLEALLDRWTAVCPLSAFAVCLFTKRYEKAKKIIDTNSSSKYLEHDLDEFVILFESFAFTEHRLALVSSKGKDLAECLLKVAMLMSQGSSGFKQIMNRLQLVNIFKLL